MLILQSERLRALTKRGAVAFTRDENLSALRGEALELALAVDRLLAGRGSEEEVALEAGDVVNMLDRLRELVGAELWDQALAIKLSKAEARVSEREAERAAKAAEVVL